MQIFDQFDVKRKGVIDFGDFVRSLNVFHPNAPEEDKIDCKQKWSFGLTLNCIPDFGMQYKFIYTLHIPFMAVSFKLYDLENTGFIERQEVYYCFYLFIRNILESGESLVASFKNYWILC